MEWTRVNKWEEWSGLEGGVEWTRGRSGADKMHMEEWSGQ